MKKQLFCGLLAAAAISLPAKAAWPASVQVDGQVLEGPCHLESGVTYAPLRQFLDVVGGWDLRWDSGRKAAVATSGSETLIADPVADTVTLNGTAYSGGVYVLEGRTYVPLRLMAELLGGRAAWDPYFGGAAVTSASAGYDAGELYWLSRIISAESRGEPIEGQIAVGNVVLNRVESEDFPNTIQDVIFDCVDAIQFEPVGNGTVYNDPAAQSVEAAMRVLDGEETLEGAMFFYAPALSPGTWINETRTYLTTIGCHRFYL